MNNHKNKKAQRIGSLCALEDAGLLPCGMDEASREAIENVVRRYGIGISAHVRSLLEGIENPAAHPVGRQYIPSSDELTIHPGENDDPIGDERFTPVHGVVHRDMDRVLLKVTGSCAVQCRYCFRRGMYSSGKKDHLSEKALSKALSYIDSHEEISEVILSGGDPLILSPRRLGAVLDSLEKIRHVQAIRIHTRAAVADPQRIDGKYANVLKKINKPVRVVLHVNHASEITNEVVRVFGALCVAGCSLYSQSVLLKGVNDDVEVLAALFRKLISVHVMPYYIHHLDHAPGTGHFRVSLERGQEIMRSLQGRMSGMAVPKYMLDIPGGYGKIPVHEGYVRKRGEGVYDLQDYQGCHHLYFDNDGGSRLGQNEGAETRKEG
ncbi:MAG: KamA family radical SAM protein [Alphaproteobacteria bacterium]|nr:KamA family radical SAM protein [Alphaproteobacteria bacterium]